MPGSLRNFLDAAKKSCLPCSHHERQQKERIVTPVAIKILRRQYSMIWRMSQVIGYNPDYDYLYDPQQGGKEGFCECCGRQISGAGRSLCRKCEALNEEEGVHV